MMLRTVLGSMAVSLAMSMLAGCGPGLTSRAPKFQDDVAFAQLDSELAHAIPGTTTLTSAEMMPAAPELRALSSLPLLAWDDEPTAAPAPLPVLATISGIPQTWGGIGPVDSDSIIKER